MKKILTLLLVISSLYLTSCSSDDDNSSGNEYPKTVNIKYDITTTQYTDAVVTRTLDNDTQTENFDSFPYSYTYVQQEVNQGTYLKLTFMHNLAQTGGVDDYEAELKIYCWKRSC
ncbi:hypothetical protein [Winogradskyella forsetii]|uniref:hypothetical protein n=1 Tax=Winogradskyella forsetii TaxID=2686077 RepID=UPI0015BAD034|nr:hypothetical protein [Winogradskyella forsetii]